MWAWIGLAAIVAGVVVVAFLLYVLAQYAKGMSSS